MAIIVGNTENKQSVEFKPVQIDASGYVKYLSEQSIRTSSNRAGDFQINLDDRLYEYTINGAKQFIIRVPAGSLTYDVSRIIALTFGENEGDDDHDHPFVSISGGTMTGPLILSEHPDEDDSEYQSASKGYVDDAIDNQERQLQFHQTTPDYVWRFEHNLGKWPVITTTFDDPEGQRFFGDNRYIDENVIEVRLKHARTGTITLHY